MPMLVQDVMTVDVAAVREKTTLRVIAELLVNRKVSGLPVVDADCRVVGVVSEADLLHKVACTRPGTHNSKRAGAWWRLRRHRVPIASADVPMTAAGLMTHQPATIRADASIVTAARMMEYHEVKRLPVVDSDARLCGIISRRDVMRVFLRTDQELVRRVRRDVLAVALPKGAGTVHVAADNGVVTLTGHLAKHSQSRAVIRLAEEVDGVIAVVDQLSWDDGRVAATRA